MRIFRRITLLYRGESAFFLLIESGYRSQGRSFDGLIKALFISALFMRLPGKARDFKTARLVFFRLSTHPALSSFCSWTPSGPKSRSSICSTTAPAWALGSSATRAPAWWCGQSCREAFRTEWVTLTREMLGFVVHEGRAVFYWFASPRSRDTWT